MIFDDEGVQNNVGVVSNGYGCGSEEFPGLYARVDSYLDWLDQRIYGTCARSLFQ